MLEQVLGRADLGKVMRAHLARLAPGARVRIHRDRGGYVDGGHRIHVPLQVGSRNRVSVYNVLPGNCIHTQSAA